MNTLTLSLPVYVKFNTYTNTNSNTIRHKYNIYFNY